MRPTRSRWRSTRAGARGRPSSSRLQPPAEVSTELAGQPYYVEAVVDNRSPYRWRAGALHLQVLLRGPRWKSVLREAGPDGLLGPGRLDSEPVFQDGGWPEVRNRRDKQGALPDHRRAYHDRAGGHLNPRRPYRAGQKAQHHCPSISTSVRCRRESRRTSRVLSAGSPSRAGRTAQAERSTSLSPSPSTSPARATSTCCRTPAWPDMPGWRTFDAAPKTISRIDDGLLIGRRTYERTLVPREAGDFTIPPGEIHLLRPLERQLRDHIHRSHTG